MRIQLESQSETLDEFRAELEAFLGSDRKNATAMTSAAINSPAARKPRTPKDAVVSNVTAVNTATIDAAKPSAADIAFGLDADGPCDKHSVAPSPPAQDAGHARSAADVALGLDPAEDADNKVSHQPDVEQLLANKAQLHFDFDRVLALQGRAAALGIVRSVLPAGTKTKIKDIEALPETLIPAAIAALQAAQVA
jgi:hypothetical protein